MIESDSLGTADLYLAAALIVTGHTPSQLIARDHRTIFTFAPSADIRAIVEDYYRRNLQVDALAYAEAVRSAKSAAVNIAKSGRD